MEGGGGTSQVGPKNTQFYVDWGQVPGYPRLGPIVGPVQVRAEMGPCVISDFAVLVPVLLKVKELRLRNVRFKNKTFEALMNNIAHSTSLRVLGMGGCGGSVGRDHARFGEMLSINHSLSSIDLKDNELTPDAATSIGEGLKNNIRITEINFSSNPLDLAIKDIAKALIAAPRPLKEFHLALISPHRRDLDLRGYSSKIVGSANELVVDGLVACSGTMGCLENLSLGHQARLFNAASTPKLVRLLELNTCLRTLKLTSSVVGRGAIRDAIAGLSRLTRLVMLGEQHSMGFNRVGEKEELEALTDILRRNPSIRQISVAGYIDLMGTSTTALWEMLLKTPRGAQPVEFLEGDYRTNEAIVLAGRKVAQAQNLAINDRCTSSDISQIFAGIWRKRFITFAMGTHARLGENAKNFVLDMCITKMILMSITGP
jgi:hypothetical protein